MNQSFCSLVVGALLLGALPSAFASSSANLTVSGSIRAVACTPSLDRTNVDLGDILASDLEAEKHTKLPVQYVRLNINCPSAIKFAISSVDSQAGTADPGFDFPGIFFGFGLTPAGEKLGSYRLVVIPNQSDSGSGFDDVFPTVGNADGTSWAASSRSPASIRTTGELVGIVNRAGSTAGPIPLKNVSLRLQLESYIAPANGLTLNGGVTLDGQATLMLKYL